MSTFGDMLANMRLDDDFDFIPPLLPLYDNDDDLKEEQYPDSLPILILRNTVMFPGMIIPITISRPKSILAIEEAEQRGRLLGVLAQKEIETENPTSQDLYRIGTVARIMKLLKMPDGGITAILQGRTRFQLEEVLTEDPFLEGKISILPDLIPHFTEEYQALVASITDMAKQIIRLSPNIPNEATAVLKNIGQRGTLLNFVASNINVKVEVRQAVLEENNAEAKAKKILELIDKELQLLQLRNKIENKVRVDLDKQQRDYFLNQQLKTIHEELGHNSNEKELEILASKAEDMDWPEEVQKAFDKELKKAKRTNPAAPDYSLVINYLEFLLELPWKKYTKDNFNLKKAQNTLDKDHFGLEKVKDRILEHLAVLKLKGDMKAPILCLVGPPGVGKTSLGKSIAKALKRKYIRMSLGGLHDESEIRGHRKTYIGARPGRIMQSLKKVATSNPVFILDEIDKVGKSFRGDPSSALLEVLDPEQNSTFYDNYLELEYDLSKVMFIATANSLATIQPALLDRMEIIHVSGYSVEEKVEIGKQHLIPQQRQEHGLKGKDVKFKPEIIAKIIQDYTRESGVRE